MINLVLSPESVMQILQKKRARIGSGILSAKEVGIRRIILKCRWRFIFPTMRGF